MIVATRVSVFKDAKLQISEILRPISILCKTCPPDSDLCRFLFSS